MSKTHRWIMVFLCGGLGAAVAIAIAGSPATAPLPESSPAVSLTATPAGDVPLPDLLVDRVAPPVAKQVVGSDEAENAPMESLGKSSNQSGPNLEAVQELIERIRQQTEPAAASNASAPANASPSPAPVAALPDGPLANPLRPGAELRVVPPPTPANPLRPGADLRVVNPPPVEANPATALQRPAGPVEQLPAPGVARIDNGAGDDRLSIYIQDKDIREVLALLSEQGALNILPSKAVQGNVSANLNGVTIDAALDAILRSTGYLARREGAFIFVGTPADFAVMQHTLDTVGTRIYRPNYVNAQELESLVTPLLSPGGIGKIKATVPAKTGIAPNDADAEGNNPAGADAVLVQDYEAVLCAIDQVVQEIDRRPAQVAIEAMILSVKLDDTSKYGVDFLFLRDQKHVRLATGTPLQDIAKVSFDGGLKFAFLDSNLGAFLNALETIGDTNVIATPRVMVLNKHRAEILIGSQLGYVSTSQTETSTTQSVSFLEVGCQLRLRPFVSNDGLIRMEVHPELSKGSVRVEGGFTLPDKEVTQVTTNIMVRDGWTVVIGGLLREDLTTNTSQVPLVGNLPVVGALFRTKTEKTEKRELLVLVTPRIVHEPAMYQEGEQGAMEFHRRQGVYQDKMSPLGKRSLGRKYLRLAQEAWDRNDGPAALRFASCAIQFDPLNRAAIDLRSDIWANRHDGEHSGGAAVPPPLLPQALDLPQLPPDLLNQLECPVLPPPGPPITDPGVPGYGRRIEPGFTAP